MLVNDIVIAPDHLRKVAFGNARFDVGAVKPLVALDIKPVGTAGDGALGIDRAGAGRWIKHRAGDAMRAVDGQLGNSSADFGELFGRQRGQPRLQQFPFRRAQLRHVGKLSAAGVAALGTRPVRGLFADSRDAGVNVGVEQGDHGSHVNGSGSTFYRCWNEGGYGRSGMFVRILP